MITVEGNDGKLLEVLSKVEAKEAWQEKRKRPNSTLAEKTKKNVYLEATLFCIVSIGFLAFNISYWTAERNY